MAQRIFGDAKMKVQVEAVEFDPGGSFMGRKLSGVNQCTLKQVMTARSVNLCITVYAPESKKAGGPDRETFRCCSVVRWA